MAAIGNILRKATLSNRSTAEYTPVNQDASDNEEEDDDVVFTRNGLAANQNGLKNGTSKSTESEIQAIEMGKLGIQKAKILKSSEVEVRVMKMTIVGKTRILCLILTILLCVLLAFASALYFGGFLTYKKVHVHHYDQTPDWNIEYEDYNSDSMIRLVDFDDDGRLDILMGITRTWPDVNADMSKEEIRKLCQLKDLSYPCVGKVVAIRGHDGKELYSVTTHHAVFEMDCQSVDINKDGKPDCVASGRASTLLAFDPKDGTILWTGDPSALVEHWNVYGMMALPDFNEDGVPEILVSHGGNPRFKAWSSLIPGYSNQEPKSEHERETARLLMLDGATGKVMGRYLDMPEPRETYIPPVMHTRKDGSQYVLFGDGGETVQGSLLAISVPDLYRYVMLLKPDASVPHVKGAYEGWEKHVMDKETGILEIFRGQTKGFVTPPVCVDMDDDGVNDILMMCNDGTFVLYNGETLDKMWDLATGAESYMVPAPGYFNEDDTLDFMVHLNIGAFSNYTSHRMMVIDGKTGHPLWTYNMSMMPLVWSSLTVRTSEQHRDAFLFRTVMGLDLEEDTKTRRKRAPHGGEEHFPSQYRTRPGPYYKKKNGQESSGHGNSGRVPSRYGNSNNNMPSQYGHSGFGTRKQIPPRFGDSDNNNNNDDADGDSDNNNNNDDADGYLGNMADRLGNLLGGYGAGASMPKQYGNEDGYPNSRYPPRYVYYDNAGEEEEGGQYPNEFEGYEENANDADADHDGTAPDHHAHQHPSKAAINHEPFPCGVSVDSVSSEIYLFDRTTMSNPVKIAQLPYYEKNITEEFVADQKSVLSNERKRRRRHFGMGDEGAELPEYLDWDEIGVSWPQCVVLVNQLAYPGAIGDVDGDGTLDFVIPSSFFGRLLINFGEDRLVTPKHTTKIFKFNMASLLPNGTNTPINAAIDHTKFPEKTKPETKLQDLKFLPAKNQPWTEYMGAHSDSVYTP